MEFLAPRPTPGLQHAGVVVALAYLTTDPVVIGTTMAHEGGHFLGLFHTSERSGLAHDPLLDTPECTRADDANGDGRLDWNECTGKDTANLMFWSNGDVPQETLTNDQRFVLLRNPSIH
jgi:hypothetical protein